MADSDAETPPQRRGWADKRAAVSRGARMVFARDGYTRASIDAIAVEAGVSTRTIYNHFGDKEKLFTAVVLESSAQVRQALVAATGQHLDHVSDLESALTGLAHAWVTTMTQFAEHFTLIQQLAVTGDHLPPQVREAWEDTGPRAARAVLAHHFRRLAQDGQLLVADPDRAALHFHLLAFTEITERSQQGSAPLDADDTAEVITAGVRAFLRGYLPLPG